MACDRRHEHGCGATTALTQPTTALTQPTTALTQPLLGRLANKAIELEGSQALHDLLCHQR